MFKSLRSKLKGAISQFSGKIEEEGKDEEIEVPVEQAKKENTVSAEKQEKEESKDLEIDKKEISEKEPEETEDKETGEKQESEKKGFFSKFKNKFFKKEEDKEEFEEIPIEKFEEQKEKQEKKEQKKEKHEEEIKKAEESVKEKLSKKEVPSIQELTERKGEIKEDIQNIEEDIKNQEISIKRDTPEEKKEKLEQVEEDLEKTEEKVDNILEKKETSSLSSIPELDKVLKREGKEDLLKDSKKKQEISEQPKESKVIEKEEKKQEVEIPEKKKEEKQEIEEISEKEPEETEDVNEPEKQEKKGFFSRLKQRITTKKIDENQFDDFFWDLELVLLENNVAVEVIEKIKQDLKSDIVDQPIKRSEIADKITESLKNTISSLFDIEKIDLSEKARSKKPFVVCFVGINGSGKTTTIAKVANLLKEDGLSCILAASDTFRAAAIDQLQLHADKLNIKLIKHDYGSDAAAVAFDAIKHAKAKDIDVVLIDTAGRIHSNVNLMDEMKKIIRVADPDMKIFVGESITGNDCTEQAKKFNEAIGIDGIILSKADIDEKGGAAISVSHVTNKPILYIGTGQEYSDLKRFDSETIISSLGL